MAHKPKPVQTVPQALAWIRRNLTPAQMQANGHKTPRAALLWFAACERAEGLADMSLRELAELLVDGAKPLTLAELREDWAEDAANWAQDTADGSIFDLTESLSGFFLDKATYGTDDEEG